MCGVKLNCSGKLNEFIELHDATRDKWLSYNLRDNVLFYKTWFCAFILVICVEEAVESKYKG